MENLLTLYRTCASMSKTCSFAWDVQADHFIYDTSLQDVLPYPLPQQHAKKFLEECFFLPESDRKRFRKHISFLCSFPFRRARQLKSHQIVLRIQCENQELLYYRLIYMLAIHQDGGKIVCGTLQDISHFYQENAALKKSLQHDAMTGLYAKTFAPQLSDQLLTLWGTKGRCHALLVLDLDCFKQVNDKLGHLIGDAVIIDLALALKINFRRQDVLGHIGGDEFVVFMPNAEKQDVLTRCQKLRAAMRRKLGQEENVVHLTGSIGIAFAPEHGADYHTLFSHADSALYEAKRRGRDSQVIYDEAMEERQHMVEGSSATSIAYHNMMAHPSDYIFRLVLHSKDTAISVRLLLEIFAKHFHVQRAYVFWNIDGLYWPRLLYEYRAKESDLGFRAHDPEVRRLMWCRYTEESYGRFTECTDTAELSTHKREIFQRAGIRAWMECAMMEGSEFLGGVGFDDTEAVHSWTRAEHEVLAAFANIMHRFLLGQIYYERTRNAGALYL